MIRFIIRWILLAWIAIPLWLSLDLMAWLFQDRPYDIGIGLIRKNFFSLKQFNVPLE